MGRRVNPDQLAFDLPEPRHSWERPVEATVRVGAYMVQDGDAAEVVQ